MRLWLCQKAGIPKSTESLLSFVSIAGFISQTNFDTFFFFILASKTAQRNYFQQNQYDLKCHSPISAHTGKKTFEYYVFIVTQKLF